MVLANSISSWLKKWGLWILVGLVFLLWLLSKLIPSPKDKTGILQKAKDEAQAIKSKTDTQLVAHEKQMEANRDELKKIQSIEDEKERLSKLADFINRR